MTFALGWGKNINLEVGTLYKRCMSGYLGLRACHRLGSPGSELFDVDEWAGSLLGHALGIIGWGREKQSCDAA